MENLYARVLIQGRDYLFKVDTGAAQTVITTRLAHRLHRPVVEASRRASTVGCETSVLPMRMSRWSLGAAVLPPATVLSQHDLANGLRVDGQQVVGLLGSDVLSRFGDVTLDFTSHKMLLGGHAVRGRVVPMEVEKGPVGGVSELLKVVIDGRTTQLLIDTGSPLTLLDAQTSTQDRLQRGSRDVVIHGAAGCSSEQTLVLIRNWRTGRLRLPPAFALTPRKLTTGPRSNQPVGGLIGLSVLSTFRALTIEFTTRQLAFVRSSSSVVSPASIIVILGAILLLVGAGVWIMRRDGPNALPGNAEPS